MADERRRIAIAFFGNPGLSLRVSESDLQELRKALEERREGWLEVMDADGAVLVDLTKVIYVRVESGEHRVGF